MPASLLERLDPAAGRGRFAPLPKGHWGCARRWREFVRAPARPGFACAGYRMMGMPDEIDGPGLSLIHEVHDFLNGELVGSGLSLCLSYGTGLVASWGGEQAASAMWLALEDLAYALDVMPGSGGRPIRLLVRDLLAEPVPAGEGGMPARSRWSRDVSAWRYVRLADRRCTPATVRAAAAQLGAAAGLGSPVELRRRSFVSRAARAPAARQATTHRSLVTIGESL